MLKQGLVKVNLQKLLRGLLMQKNLMQIYTRDHQPKLGNQKELPSILDLAEKQISNRREIV